MKHETILAGEDWSPRDARVGVNFDVLVHSDAGSIDAHILNLSADGFRLYSAKPIAVGAEVTLEAAREFPVKALICWASGLESGGVFADPVTL